MERQRNETRVPGWLVRSFCSALDDEDALVGLGLLVELLRILERVECDFIELALARGHTWQTIARWLQLDTRQAAHQRALRRGVDVDRARARTRRLDPALALDEALRAAIHRYNAALVDAID